MPPLAIPLIGAAAGGIGSALNRPKPPTTTWQSQWGAPGGSYDTSQHDMFNRIYAADPMAGGAPSAFWGGDPA